MKFKLYLTLILLIAVYQETLSQMDVGCKVFVKKGFSTLDTSTFTHDGRYNALKLSPGQTFEIYKPFYKTRNYRIVVLADEKLPGITFEILDVYRKPIYTSGKYDITQYYDYTPDKNQNLVIRVKVGESEKNKTDKKDTPETFCVGVLIGYE